MDLLNGVTVDVLDHVANLGIDVIEQLLHAVVVNLIGFDHVELFEHDWAQLAHVVYVIHRFR